MIVVKVGVFNKNKHTFTQLNEVPESKDVYVFDDLAKGALFFFLLRHEGEGFAFEYLKFNSRYLPGELGGI